MAGDVIMTSLLLLKIAKTFQLGVTCENYKKYEFFEKLSKHFFLLLFTVLMIYFSYRILFCRYLIAIE